MDRSPIFQLTVCRIDTKCSFMLTSWSDNQQYQADLEYPRNLDQRYETWYRLYLKAYSSPLRGQAEESGSFTPSLSDLHNQLEEAKRILLDTFNRWLGGLREIRERIQREVPRQIMENRRTKTSDCCVDLLVACNFLDLARLPWEAWEFNSEAIRISRTIMNVGNEAISDENLPWRVKKRILAILADDPELDLLSDQRSVLLLGKVADVELLKRNSGENSQEFKQRLADKIADEQGWDVLIFAGHSEETSFTGGKLVLASDVHLSLSEIDPALNQARRRGLQVAIFNSCQGLRIAEYLIQMGLSQVVVMRERIHDRAAHTFLQEFCQSLTNYKNVHEAVLDACRCFQRQNMADPGAYLIPSMFRHPSAMVKLFRFEPSRLKRFWHNWKPTRREAIAFSTVLLLSLMVPVQDLLFDLRTFAQAAYRYKTQQLPRNAQPPVLLVAIDQESINQASQKIDQFQIWPMDRQYLGQLVSHLLDLRVKTIGIDYELYTQEFREEKLAKVIKSGVGQKGTWFVFAINEENNQKVFPNIANSNWSLQGDINFLTWDVQLPADETCSQSCPFGYLLALSHQLNSKPTLSNLPKPTLESRSGFQKQVSQWLKQENVPNNVIASLKKGYSPFGLRSIIDFSIPPNQVYERIPAWKFLKLGPPNPELQNRIEQQVAIISSGGYERAEDNYSVPLAIEYWCNWLDMRKEKDCPQVFTGGEAQAYIVHHLLSPHRVTLIPNLWMIGLTAIFGKWTALMLLKQKRKQRRLKPLILVSATGVYGIVLLQVHISASVLIPWFLPSITFWTCVLSVFRRNPHA
jgi:hypothetical protein